MAVFVSAAGLLTAILGALLFQHGPCLMQASAWYMSFCLALFLIGEHSASL